MVRTIVAVRLGRGARDISTDVLRLGRWCKKKRIFFFQVPFYAARQDDGAHYAAKAPPPCRLLGAADALLAARDTFARFTTRLSDLRIGQERRSRRHQFHA